MCQAEIFDPALVEDDLDPQQYGYNATLWLSLYNNSSPLRCAMPGNCSANGDVAYLQCNSNQDILFYFWDPIRWRNASQLVLSLSFRVYGLLGCGSSNQSVLFNEIYVTNFSSVATNHCLSDGCSNYCDESSNRTGPGDYIFYRYGGYNKIALPPTRNNSYMCVSKIDLGITYNSSCLNDCNQNGICRSNGTCECNKGWSGKDCSNSTALKCCVYNQYFENTSLTNQWCQPAHHSCLNDSNWNYLYSYQVSDCASCGGCSRFSFFDSLLDFLMYHRRVVTLALLLLALLLVVWTIRNRRRTTVLEIPLSGKPSTPL